MLDCFLLKLAINLSFLFFSPNFLVKHSRLSITARMLTVYEICFAKFELEGLFIKKNLMTNTLFMKSNIIFQKLTKEANIIENISQEILLLLNALWLGKGSLHGIFLHSSPHQKRKKLPFSLLRKFFKKWSFVFFFSFLNGSQLLTSMSATAMVDGS